jgi:hypothetical protein
VRDYPGSIPGHQTATRNLLSGARKPPSDHRMSTPEELYKYYVANLRKVDKAFRVTARLLRASIAREESSVTEVLTTSQTLLLGVWSEARLAKLLYEKNGFSHNERRRVNSAESLLEKWQATVEIGFRKH